MFQAVRDEIPGHYPDIDIDEFIIGDLERRPWGAATEKQYLGPPQRIREIRVISMDQPRITGRPLCCPAVYPL